jgi:aspartyl protease family protein
MIGWALKQALLWGAIACAAIVLLNARLRLFPDAPPHLTAPTLAAAVPSGREEPARLVFRVGPSGHVVVGAVVNGAAMRMLVDTGATLVALTPRDARAAGIGLGALQFNGRVATAAGTVRAAPVRLREIRLGQFSVYDVRAEVLERLGISLLGMSFLDRLKSYEMRDGTLILRW